VTTTAICALDSWDFQAGMIPLYVWPPTTTFPLKPSFTIWMTFAGSPVTTGLPANGGKEPGAPFPLRWWHVEQLVEKTAAPVAEAIAGARVAGEALVVVLVWLPPQLANAIALREQAANAFIPGS